jgi:hypothetical protein
LVVTSNAITYYTGTDNKAIASVLTRGTPPSAPANTMSGVWHGNIRSIFPFGLNITQNNNQLSGAFLITPNDGCYTTGTTLPLSGTVTGEGFVITTDEGDWVFSGTYSGSSMSGMFTSTNGCPSGPFTATLSN